MNRATGNPRFRFSRALPSRLKAVDAACRELRRTLRAHGLQSLSFQVELAAREGLNNAVLHGNGRDARRFVQLEVHCAHKWICLRIQDEGAGFNWRKARRIQPAPSATGGRGMSIMAAYADRVCFNRLGNRVTLWVKKESRKRKN